MINKIIEQFKNVISKGFFTIFLASTLTSVLSFVASTVIVRFVSKSEFGIYTYANNQLSFFLLLSGLGVASGVLQLCSETNENDKNTALGIFQYGCKVGIIVNLILGALIYFYTYVIHFPIGKADEVLRIMCLIPLITLLPQLQTSYLRSRIRNNEFACASILRAVLSCFLLILGSYYFEIKGLIIGTYLTGIITIIVVSIAFDVPVITRKTVKIKKAAKQDLLKISMISMINNALSEVLYLLDIFLIAAFIENEVMIASYKVATVIPTGLTFIPASIITFIYPYFARNRLNKEWVKKNYIRVIIGSLCLDALIAGVLFVIAPWLITFLFGNIYADAVLCFRILLIGFAFSGTFRVISGNILVTQRQLTYNTFVAIVSGIVNIIADIILIKYYGAVGAAIATVVVQFISGILNTTRMFHVLRA